MLLASSYDMYSPMDAKYAWSSSAEILPSPSASKRRKTSRSSWSLSVEVEVGEDGVLKLEEDDLE